MKRLIRSEIHQMMHDSGTELNGRISEPTKISKSTVNPFIELGRESVMPLMNDHHGKSRNSLPLHSTSMNNDYKSIGLGIQDSECFVINDDGDREYLDKGLFTYEDIKDAEVIGVFSGKKVTFEQYEDSNKKRFKKGEFRQYGLQLSNSKVLDCYDSLVGNEEPNM